MTPALFSRVVDDLGGIEDLLGHHPGVPVRGPALVHDLGLLLGDEVVGLGADDIEDVALPPLERGVIEEELEHVALGPLGDPALGLLGVHFLALGLEVLLGVDEGVHVLLGGEARDGLGLLVFLLLRLRAHHINVR